RREHRILRVLRGAGGDHRRPPHAGRLGPLRSPARNDAHPRPGCRNATDLTAPAHLPGPITYDHGAMTAVSAEIGRGTTAGRGDVFAAGSDGRRRRAWIAGGTALLVLAYFDWLVGDWSPSLAPLARTSALLLGLVGATIVGVALWRRTRRYEVSAAGILLSHGG